MPPDFIDISPEHNGGILKKIIKEGVGDEKPPIGCEVEVSIKNVSTGSSDTDGEITKFKLGKGKIVRGCEIGISSMRKGEKATLICAPQYANIFPSISETSTLEFHIELINWEYEDLSPKKDGGIRRIILMPGEGTETPNEGAKAEIHIIGKFQDKVFDQRENISFCVGEGLEYDIVQGIDIALAKFKKGEKSRLLLKSHYAFKEVGFEKFGIPPNADVEYEVTLLSFTRVKDIWLMSDDEKVKEASQLKERGNIYFQQGKLQLASSIYRRVIQMLKLFEDGRHIREGDPECESTFFSAHMNLSLCCLKMENYQEAKHSVLVALRLRPDDEKAHFRAGKVFFALGEYRAAIDSFQECLEINPNNKAALVEIKLSSNAVKEHIKQERKIYGQMFDRFAEEDSQREKSEMRKIFNVMSSVGEWGAEDREREPSEFEKENPDILLLNKTGEFKDM
ncbi:peptidyl-prolyl cis-trans isomerase FKBP4-like [Coccinella septempunctata]|uniref:peptidyl-prolyl cis-trans isomerase FKBP4-like n=1 Tax=Coccinella septempunctata TaxID=41139 RepID=UPI001D06637D|nr:peptidyl-prolyl cis-trans isomerase FKBP4-like [Coccinella septempunctata]